MLHRIVITGAPASGKSVFIARLKAYQRFARFVFFDEIARKLLEKDPTYRNRWAEFHHEVYRQQIKQEEALAGQSFFTDRGTADAFAFHPETARHCGTTIEDEYRRYDAVILLGSAAALGDEYYQQDDVRLESAGQVMALEKATIDVWKGHPNFQIIEARTDPEAKYLALVDFLLNLVGEPK